MDFECEFCNYSTNDSSNYKKHIKSARHNKIINNIEKTKYKCNKCGNIYLHHSGFYRHTKGCNGECHIEYGLDFNKNEKYEKYEKYEKSDNDIKIDVKIIQNYSRIT
jgi:hypothetical protein